MVSLEEQLNNLVKMLDDEKDLVKRDMINRAKAEVLEELKPSTKEEIVYFLEDTIDFIPEGFSNSDENIKAVVLTGRRSLMEYNKLQRHPIPYCIVKYGEEYFFTLRKDKSGEIRLIGKKGLLGGHVGKEDIIVNGSKIDIAETLRTGMFRELEEEAGITKELIDKIEYKGLIKLQEGVEKDHLGVVYEITLNTKDIKALEKGVLDGIWINKYMLPLQYDSLETWAKLIYHNIITS